MKVPDWMKMPLDVLGGFVEDIPEDAEKPAEVVVLEKLFAANLLNLELQDGPVREGETMLVRGMLMRVKYVQDRRLVLELPPGRRFKRPEDGRLVVAAPRKAGG